MGEAHLEAARRDGPFPGAIAPSYSGAGLYNVAHTVLETLGVESGPGLDPAALDPELVRGAKRIVLFIVDGLGFEQLREVMAHDSLALADAGREGQLTAITSVSPSTTTTAMATLCTAAPPRSHGLLGYRLFLKEYGGVMNMIRFAPAIGGPSLESRGVNPREFFTAPTIFSRLAKAGKGAHVVTRSQYAGSALSRMLHTGAEFHTYSTVSDFFVRTVGALKELGDGPGLVFAYWDMVDHLAHKYGALGPEYRAELSAFDHLFDHLVRNGISGGDTLVLLTADHGHINVPADRRIDLREHAGLMDSLQLSPSGEPRFVFLYPEGGRETEVREYLDREFQGMGATATAAEALERGYFGPGKDHPETRGRLGDIHLMPTGDHAFVYPYPGERGELIGRHGGFTSAEMLVPLLAFRA